MKLRLLKPSPRQFGFDRSTVRLLKAIRANSASAVRRAIRDGADPNAVADDGMTPLLFSVFHPRSLAALEALLEAGADPNHYDPRPEVPAFMNAAVVDPDPHFLRLALKHGGNPEMLIGKESLACRAVLNSRDTNLRILLDAGADINQGFGGGGEETLLLLLTVLRKYELALELLDRGADPLVESSGKTIACYLADVESRVQSGPGTTYRVFRDAAVERGVTFPAVAPWALWEWRHFEKETGLAPRPLAELSGVLPGIETRRSDDFDPRDYF